MCREVRFKEGGTTGYVSRPLEGEFFYVLFSYIGSNQYAITIG